jgi:hypothetical protein
LEADDPHTSELPTRLDRADQGFCTLVSNLELGRLRGGRSVYSDFSDPVDVVRTDLWSPCISNSNVPRLATVNGTVCVPERPQRPLCLHSVWRGNRRTGGFWLMSNNISSARARRGVSPGGSTIREGNAMSAKLYSAEEQSR